MQNIIEWLMKIERLAGDLYTQAGAFFREDKPLQAFLESSAEDEEWHYRVMARALTSLRELPDARVDITMDQELSERIEAVFLSMTHNLSMGTLSKRQLLDGIADVEFSEWNDLFLYVVNSLKGRLREFSHVASRIENHKRNILHYFEGLPEKSQSIARLQRTSSVWQERILIVEDDDALREVLGSILKTEGVVETASNGRIGAEMARASYFRVILSDIDMPEMDGFRMFDALRNTFPTIPSRFIFMSGYFSPERIAFLEHNAIDFLPKPSSIRTIRECVLRNLRKDLSPPF